VHTGSGSREPASNPGEKQRGKARRPLASHRIAGRSCCEHVGIADADPSTATCGSVDGWISGTRRCRPCYPPSLLLLLLLPAYVPSSRGEAGAPSHDLVSRAWLVRSAARAAGSGMDGSTPLAERGVVPAAAVVSWHACTVQGTVTVFCFGCRDGCCDEANHRGRVRWHSGMSWWYRVRGQRRHMAPAMAEYSTRRP
jgi:hypothetical protein